MRIFNTEAQTGSVDHVAAKRPPREKHTTGNNKTTGSPGLVISVVRFSRCACGAGRRTAHGDPLTAIHGESTGTRGARGAAGARGARGARGATVVRSTRYAAYAHREIRS